MVLTPVWITAELFADALRPWRRKHRPAGLSKVRLETFDEGRCIQTLHAGPYDDEAAVLAKCTTTSFRRPDCGCPESTTRSTSTMLGAFSRPDFEPYCGSRWKSCSTHPSIRSQRR